MCVAEEQQHVASAINLRPQNEQFRAFLPGIAILQQIDASIERLLAGFRWQRIDFVDALKLSRMEAASFHKLFQQSPFLIFSARRSSVSRSLGASSRTTCSSSFSSVSPTAFP